MINDTAVAVEVEPMVESEIRNDQLEDAKLKEIHQFIRENKTSDFTEDDKGTLWLRRQICIANLKPI
jgi:hypothetical protein